MNQVERTRTVLTNPDVHGTTLLAWFLDQFGGKAMEWHPLAIRAEVNHALGAVLPDLNFDRLMAAIAVMTTDLFFQDARRFTMLANILCGGPLIQDVFEPPDAVECAWAVTESLLLSPPEEHEADNYFSPEVRAFIGGVLREEGFVSPPDVLRIASDADFKDRVTYEFSDDPAMFQAVFQGQQSKAAEVDTAVKDGLRSLLAQLKALPFQGKTILDLEQKVQLDLGTTTGR